jgi:two-component system chemotaxis response regulator CheB
MTEPYAKPALIVIGASAGGLEPLLEIVRGLPADLAAAVCVVVHVPATATSLLPRILQRAGQLPATHAENGQPLAAGCIYVARPDHHLLISDGHLSLSRGPQHNSHRPAIDPLFQTAARSQGPRVIGVILSGTLDDGTYGLRLIKARGGVAIVQDPASALFDAMPRNAMAVTTPDYVLPAPDIGPVLARLALERAQLSEAEVAARKKGATMTQIEHEDQEAAVVAQDKAQLENGGRPGEPSVFTCPDCGGVLWELNDDDLLRYRCHVGHAYSADGLRAEQANALEEALWTAIRSLEESASLARRLAYRARQGNNLKSARHFDARAQEDEERADLVRRALAGSEAMAEHEAAALNANVSSDA